MSDLTATPLLHSSQPVLKVDGQEKPELGAGLLSLLVEETTAGLYRCELTVGNWGSATGEVDYLYFNRQLLDFGKKLEIQTGAGDAAGTIFKGRITGLEGRYLAARPPEVTVLAEDRLQDLRMTRRTRTWEDASDEDVIREIASQHSLTPEIDITGAGTHRTLAQVNMTDLQFLRERARAVDAEVWVDDQTLHVQARSRREGENVTLTFGQRLREFSVLADIAGQRTAVTVSGWDVAGKDAISQEATASVIQSELSGMKSGSEILQQALGERKEQVVHGVPVGDQEARTMAEAMFRRQARRFVTGTGMAEGDARIRVGTVLDLQKLGPLFSGKYYVTEVRHLFDRVQGYRTQFRVERPGIGDA